MKIGLYQRLLFALLVLVACEARAVPLVYSQESDREPFSFYIKQLVEAALASQALDYQLRPSHEILSQRRALTELRAGRSLDLYWTMTSQSREQHLRVIRVPLLKGMLGQRLLVTRRADSRFNSVESKRQLQQYSFGQGHDWPDADILEAGGLNVVRSSNYVGIMEMLARYRFDAFPLAMNEVWQEIDKRPHLSVEVNDRVLLSYAAPVFLFVHPSQQQLAQQLETGLQLLIDSGELDRLFKQHFGAYTQRARLEQKTPFRFDNPTMSVETRRAMKRYASILLVQ